MRNMIETVMGAVVLLIAAAFFIFAYQKSGKGSIDGYVVNAKFADASGIDAGSDVRIGGIKIGVVEGLELDTKFYEALLDLRIDEHVKLPADSSAAIVSSGLLGSKFVSIEPGGDENMLESGGTIKFTQSSISLEELIGKFVFSGGGVDDGKNKPAAPAEKEEGEDNPFSLGL
jgi:phospholipid/cholesterol/gamma-HCH transport system substrate-binding protein